MSYNLSTQTPSYLSSFASLAFLYFLLVHHDISPSSPRRAIFSPCENTCEPGHATGRHATKPSFLERKLPKIWVRSKASGTGCLNYRVKIERIMRGKIRPENRSKIGLDLGSEIVVTLECKGAANELIIARKSSEPSNKRFSLVEFKFGNFSEF